MERDALIATYALVATVLAAVWGAEPAQRGAALLVRPHAHSPCWRLSTRVLRYSPYVYYAPTRASSRVHRACADGRASTRHLHGITERAARCDTAKVPAESAGAVAR
eukprot:scaffold19129_cov45-Phaeocystis_antarctica.AAC.1